MVQAMVVCHQNRRTSKMSQEEPGQRSNVEVRKADTLTSQFEASSTPEKARPGSLFTSQAIGTCSLSPRPYIYSGGGKLGHRLARNPAHGVTQKMAEQKHSRMKPE